MGLSLRSQILAEYFIRHASILDFWLWVRAQVGSIATLKKIGKENAIEINARIANTVAVFIEVVDILIRSLGSVTAFGSSSVMVVTVPWRYSFHLNPLMLVAMSFSYAIFPSDPLGGFAILPSYFHHHPLSVPSYFLMLCFVSYSKRPVSLF